MTRRILLTCLALLVLSQEGFAQTKTVRFSYSSGWDAIPAVVAIEKGFLAEQGLVVNGLAISSGRTILDSLTAGTTDFAIVPNRNLILVAALRLPVKVVALSGWGTETEVIVPKEAKLGSIKDLKGKTVGLGVSSEAFPLLIRFADQNGLKPKDYTIKNLDSGEIMKALDGTECKQVKKPTRKGEQTDICTDAVVASRHFTSRLVGGGKARVLHAYPDIVKTIGVRNAGALLTRNTLIETDPQTVQKFVNGWVKAMQYIERNPKEVAGLMRVFFARQGTRVPEDLAELWVKLEKFDRAAWIEADTKDTESNAAALQQVGILRGTPKIGEFVDNRFAEKAGQVVR